MGGKQRYADDAEIKQLWCKEKSYKLEGARMCLKVPSDHNTSTTLRTEKQNQGIEKLLGLE